MDPAGADRSHSYLCVETERCQVDKGRGRCWVFPHLS